MRSRDRTGFRSYFRVWGLSGDWSWGLAEPQLRLGTPRIARSVMGHERKSERLPHMPAFPPKADLDAPSPDVGEVPISDITSTHSITSSARNKSDVGMDIPRACAVCMLSTVSNFVGRSIGSAAGSEPRAILPARTPASRYMLSRFGP